MELALLYFVVSIVICGLLAAFWFATMVPYRDGFNDVIPNETSMEWGDVGIGKTVYVDEHFSCEDVLTIRWSYPSAYQQGQSVYFSDPYEALVYVTEAVKYKNLMLDRLENTRYKGSVSNYEFLLIDNHIERELWLARLDEFREDC